MAVALQLGNVDMITEWHRRLEDPARPPPPVAGAAAAASWRILVL